VHSAADGDRQFREALVIRPDHYRAIQGPGRGGSRIESDIDPKGIAGLCRRWRALYAKTRDVGVDLCDPEHAVAFPHDEALAEQ
jgi:hypothetical protein